MKTKLFPQMNFFLLLSVCACTFGSCNSMSSFEEGRTNGKNVGSIAVSADGSLLPIELANAGIDADPDAKRFALSTHMTASYGLHDRWDIKLHSNGITSAFETKFMLTPRASNTTISIGAAAYPNYYPYTDGEKIFMYSLNLYSSYYIQDKLSFNFKPILFLGRAEDDAFQFIPAFSVGLNTVGFSKRKNGTLDFGIEYINQAFANDVHQVCIGMIIKTDFNKLFAKKGKSIPN